MKIKYFYDPLCGWCYGASSALEKAELQGIEIESYPVGLFAESGRREMSPDFANYAWSNDQRIEKITGQIFSEDYRTKILSNYSLRIDSWMATVSIAAHQSKFKGQALAFLRAIQKARYVEGLDITSLDVLTEIASSFGWNSNEFSGLIQSQIFQDKTRIQIAQNVIAYEKYRAHGVPLIVLEKDGQESILSSSAVFRKDPNPIDWFNAKKS